MVELVLVTREAERTIVPTRDSVTSLRASIAALERQVQNPGQDTFAIARAKLAEDIEREADPDGTLDPETRAKRVRAIRRLRAQRAALARWKKERERKAAAEQSQADAELDAILAAEVAR